MSFRTIVINSQSKISYKNRYLVVKKALEEKYVHFSEIDTIIVDSISVSISSYLLKEIADNKINIIFCDEKHNPFGELKTFHTRHNSSKKIYEQIKWKKSKKELIWQEIVKNKIINQAALLKKVHSDSYEILLKDVEEVSQGDKKNKEAHAAKIYFNNLFGNRFFRNDDNSINKALNYGYSILLSTINKEIAICGYLTQIGINHKNQFNEFNLSCDLMEPFRSVIDNFVFYNQNRSFDTTYKMDLVNVFNHTYQYENKKMILKDIISQYVKNTLEILSNDGKYKGFVFYEE